MASDALKVPFMLSLPVERVSPSSSSRDFPENSSQLPKTVARICFDRKHDPTTRFGVLRRATRRIRDPARCNRVREDGRSASGESPAPSKAHQKSGSFPPPALPGLNCRTTRSDSRPARRSRHGVGGATPDRNGPPPITRDHLPHVPCPLPRWIGTGACVGCFPTPRGLPRQKGGSASTISLI